jgi:hypothetical protein
MTRPGVAGAVASAAVLRLRCWEDGPDPALVEIGLIADVGDPSQRPLTALR